ncbi:hypothetical protein P9A16_34450 [Shinella sp. 838]|uniref:hypothetical protein n=1 Tax=Shinella sp. 838 TaxID=3038164 RepID=UPI00241500A9|nr:hypothetical protein [Shinella sp. 838]MDG4676187.1 hypothetical protein [Shinella sp. 838]
MAGFDYTRSGGTASRLIKKFGQRGAIRRTTLSGPSYDPIESDLDYPCTLVDLAVEERSIDGTLVLRGDRTVYLSTEGLTIEPLRTDKVVIGGDPHTIVVVQPLQPGGPVVFWELNVRR